MTSRLAIMMGGRVAEEMIFGKEKVTSGATGDIEQATKLARAMVTQLGLLGRARHRRLWREPGRGLPRACRWAAAERLRRRPPRRSTPRSPPGRGGLCTTPRRILTEKHEEFEALAEALLEYETLTGDEIRDLIAGKRPSRDARRHAARAARLGRADRRQGPQARRAGCAAWSRSRRPEAASAWNRKGSREAALFVGPVRFGAFAASDRCVCVTGSCLTLSMPDDPGLRSLRR